MENFFEKKDEYLFHNEENIELVIWEEDILKAMYAYLRTIELALENQIGSFNSYEKCCVLWICNIIEYAKEAYNSAIAGNFISLAMMNRCIIENYVCACFISRYEEERLWEKWVVNSMISSTNKFDKLSPNNKKTEGIKKDMQALCKELDIVAESYSKSEYAWTESIVNKKSPRFIDLCQKIDFAIYKDYRILSDFCHGVNAMNKANRFTFVEPFYNMLTTLVYYVQKSVEELAEDLVDEEYCEANDKFWYLMNEKVNSNENNKF